MLAEAIRAARGLPVVLLLPEVFVVGCFYLLAAVDGACPRNHALASVVDAGLCEVKLAA